MLDGKQVLAPYPLVVTPQRLGHFRANFRLLARPYALSKAVAANSRTQFAVVQHSAAAVKAAYLRRCTFFLESVSANGLYTVDLVRLTTNAVTGNPGITPTAMKPGLFSEAIALALPTTGGTEGALISSRGFALNSTGSTPNTSPPAPLVEVELYGHEGEGEEPATLRAGNADGWAVVVDSPVASTVKGFVRIEFWEA